MKRREFLKNGIKIGVAANALPVMLGGLPVRALGRSPLRSVLSNSTNNNVLVIIQLQGGNDGLNCVVPFTDPNYASLRPTLGLSGTALTSPLPDHSSLALHAGMEGILSLYGNGGGNGNVAILQNVGYPNPILSHFRGTDIWNTATDSNIYASTGWVGRMLFGQNPGYPPASIPTGSWPLAIEFGSFLSNLFLANSGGMGITLSKLPTQANPTGLNYDPIPANPTTQYTELQYVRTIQEETQIYTQTLLDIAVKKNNVTYPTSTLAMQLAQIAQLIASGFSQTGSPTKLYLVTQGSYDTHSNEITTQANLLTDLSAAVAAFQADLEAFGAINGINVADSVAMMTYSEFGRRPKENGSGTDHGTAAPHFIIGTQVKGMVYGSDPKLDAASLAGAEVTGNLTFDPLHDFRNVYATVMNEWLLVGQNQSQINADILSVLTQDSNTMYSTNSNWQSLGIFKTAQTQYVGSNPNATGLMLLPNYPNPASGRTVIPYTLDVAGPVELGIFTSAGVEVERPVDSWQSAGNQQISFDASTLANGTYFYRLTTSSGTVTRPMVVEH